MKKNAISKYKKLIANNISINLSYRGYSPILELAKNGHHKIIEHLIPLGASKNLIVCGYAWARATAQVDHLLRMGANIDFAVKGYAHANAIGEVRELIYRGANPSYAAEAFANKKQITYLNEMVSLGANMEYIIYSFAQKNYSTQVKNLLFRSPDIKLLNAALQGYASAGNVHRVNQLIKKGANADNAIKSYAANDYEIEAEQLIQTTKTDLKCAVFGYAKAGMVHNVERYLEINPNYVNEAMRGYINGFHFCLANQLLARGANKRVALMSYASVRARAQVYELLREGGSINDAMRKYAEKCYLAEAEDLLDIGGNYTIIPQALLKNGFLEHKENLRRILALTKFDRLRFSIRYKANKYPQHIGSIIIKECIFYNRLMNEFGFNLQEAIIWAQNTSLVFWFLMGMKAVLDAKISLDIFIHISTFLTGLDTARTYKFFDKAVVHINKNLLLDELKDEVTVTKKIQYYLGINHNSLFYRPANDLIKNLDKDFKHEEILQDLESTTKDKNFFNKYVKKYHNRLQF